MSSPKLHRGLWKLYYLFMFFKNIFDFILFFAKGEEFKSIIHNYLHVRLKTRHVNNMVLADLRNFSSEEGDRLHNSIDEFDLKSLFKYLHKAMLHGQNDKLDTVLLSKDFTA